VELVGNRRSFFQEAQTCSPRLHTYKCRRARGDDPRQSPSLRRTSRKGCPQIHRPRSRHLGIFKNSQMAGGRDLSTFMWVSLARVGCGACGQRKSMRPACRNACDLAAVTPRKSLFGHKPTHFCRGVSRDHRQCSSLRRTSREKPANTC